MATGIALKNFRDRVVHRVASVLMDEDGDEKRISSIEELDLNAPIIATYGIEYHDVAAIIILIMRDAEAMVRLIMRDAEVKMDTGLFMIEDPTTEQLITLTVTAVCKIIVRTLLNANMSSGDAPIPIGFSTDDYIGSDLGAGSIELAEISIAIDDTIGVCTYNVLSRDLTTQDFINEACKELGKQNQNA